MEWIPVSERLPEVTGEYLGWLEASRSRQRAEIVFFSGIDKKFDTGMITFWMRLPAPPSGLHPDFYEMNGIKP